MKAETPQPFSKRTPEDIYLEYVNDWLTIERMADNYGRTEEEMKAIIDKGKSAHMKATAITVTHRKEKDVDIYTATRGPQELEIANIAHLKFTNATINRGDVVEIVDHKTAEWIEFFAAILQFKNSNDQ